jgi:hypothetical protein
MTDLPEGFPRLDKQTRQWTCKKDDEACTRQQPCASCLGARNRRKGMRKQREARKTLETTFQAEAAKFIGQLGNEEAWHGLPIRVEVKSGAQVRPIWTRFIVAEEQSQRSRAIGDNKPFLMVAMADHTTDGLAIVRLSQLAALLEAFNG